MSTHFTGQTLNGHSTNTVKSLIGLRIGVWLTLEGKLVNEVRGVPRFICLYSCTNKVKCDANIRQEVLENL